MCPFFISIPWRDSHRGFCSFCIEEVDTDISPHPIGRGTTGPVVPTRGDGSRRRCTCTTSDVVYNAFTGRSARQVLTMILPQLVSRLRSRSLTELTRQIAPPTKNGHAPPPIESRKSSQSVNPYYVWTCCSSFINPRISPLTMKYECPRLSLLIITPIPKANTIGSKSYDLELPRLLAPDLPSNGSSLRDLDCTHSNYQTHRARYCYLLSLPPRVRIGINQVAFLRDVGTAWPSTCPVSYEECAVAVKGTWYWGHGQLRMQARAWQGQGADGSSTWEAQGVPNMTGENGQAKLEPIAMHKPPQEIFARYRELGHGVVGYISMGTGLTGRKIITLATNTGDRPTTVGESLWDYSTPVGAADAPHLGFEATFVCLKRGHFSLVHTSEAPGYPCCSRHPHILRPRLPMVSEAPAHPSTKVPMLLEAPAHPRHQGGLVVRPRVQHSNAAMCGCSGTHRPVLVTKWCLMLRRDQGPRCREAPCSKGEAPGWLPKGAGTGRLVSIVSIFWDGSRRYHRDTFYGPDVLHQRGPKFSLVLDPPAPSDCTTGANTAISDTSKGRWRPDAPAHHGDGTRCRWLRGDTYDSGPKGAGSSSAKGEGRKDDSFIRDSLRPFCIIPGMDRPDPSLGMDRRSTVGNLNRHALGSGRGGAMDPEPARSRSAAAHGSGTSTPRSAVVARGTEEPTTRLGAGGSAIWIREQQRTQSPVVAHWIGDAATRFGEPVGSRGTDERLHRPFGARLVTGGSHEPTRLGVLLKIPISSATGGCTGGSLAPPPQAVGGAQLIRVLLSGCHHRERSGHNHRVPRTTKGRSSGTRTHRIRQRDNAELRTNGKRGRGTIACGTTGGFELLGVAGGNGGTGLWFRETARCRCDPAAGIHVNIRKPRNRAGSGHSKKAGNSRAGSANTTTEQVQGSEGIVMYPTAPDTTRHTHADEMN
ncbi:hypothetical protein GOBAR_AA04464 [Gossypium barbadense]|uniref:Uncharacterized protein n=1 Tax=Gossypium barbadense TaxID=3634 RepID=A0A2P5YKL7_GOSBA|nr:hypothetical protein GOBAR_AA04464 [Gossypium barbadense]